MTILTSKELEEKCEKIFLSTATDIARPAAIDHQCGHIENQHSQAFRFNLWFGPKDNWGQIALHPGPALYLDAVAAVRFGPGALPFRHRRGGGGTE